MGFMNKLSKMKSFLFDEEEIEDKSSKKQIKKNIKKADSKAKIEKFEDDFEKTQEIENLYIEDLPEDTSVRQEVKSRASKVESNFKFPEFDDDDFATVKSKPEPIIPIVKEEVKPVLYQGSKRKEETKKFKPSPIISPVYGLLDENGKEMKKESDSYESKQSSKDDITFEEVRRKAYGTLEDDTLKNLSSKTIEEAEKEMEEENKEELSRTKSKEKLKKKEDFKTVSSLKEEDDMILPNVNFKEIDVDKERLESTNIISEKKATLDDDDDEETKEQDLFNLIDSMYQGKEKEN